MLHNNIDTKIRITLQAPYTDKVGRFFSLRLKSRLSVEPAKYGRPSKMLVLSGLGGDFRTFCRILSRSKVINKHLQWIFGEGHLVILGNCFSESERSIEFLWFIYSMEEKARKSGGYLHFILGDDEMQNLNGKWRYQHPRYARGDVSLGISATALYDANNEIWRWLRTKNIVEKIGRYLFVHGGIAHELLQLDLSVTEINKYVRRYYNAVDAETLKGVLSYKLFDTELSPFKYKGYYRQELSDDEMSDILKYYRVKSIVTGYAGVKRITPLYNGKVISIAREHQEEKFEALLIVGRHFYRFNGEGKRERI